VSRRANLSCSIISFWENSRSTSVRGCLVERRDSLRGRTAAALGRLLLREGEDLVVVVVVDVLLSRVMAVQWRPRQWLSPVGLGVWVVSTRVVALPQGCRFEQRGT